MDTKTLAVWSVAPDTKKPKMMDIEETTQGNMIVWTLESTNGKEISSLVKHFALMNEEKVDEIEDKLATMFNECLDIRRTYEEELKMSHVQKQRIEELEEKIKILEIEIKSLKEQLKIVIDAEHAPRQEEERRHKVEAEAQTEEILMGTTVSTPAINVETEVSQVDNNTKKNVLMNVLNHRISILKIISQDTYNTFISLQFVE